MSAIDDRVRLMKEIQRVKERFQKLARPYQEWIRNELTRPDPNPNLDIVANSPPELESLSELLRQLEDELLMLDPTAKVPGVEEWYREMMVDRQRRREPFMPKGDPPIELSDRKTAVAQFCEKHGWKKAVFYSKARVEKGEYYRWERGELPEGSAPDQRIRRLLAET